MRVICSNCRATYDVPDERIPEKGMRVRCSKCQFVFEVKRAEKTAEPIEAEPAREKASKSVEPVLEQSAATQKRSDFVPSSSEYVAELEETINRLKQRRRINSILGVAIVVIVAAVAIFLIWQFGIKPSKPKAPFIDPQTVYLEAYDLFRKDTLDKYAEAADKLTALLSAQPSFAKGFALLSMCQSMQAGLKRDSGLLEQSRINAKKALDLDKNLPEVYLAAAILAIQEKDYSNAIDVLKSAEALDPENPQLYTVKGELFYKQGMLDEAQKALTEAIKRDSRDARAHYLLALVLKEKQDYAGALGMLKQVLEISHTHYDAIRLKGELEQAVVAEKERKPEQAVSQSLKEEKRPAEEQKLSTDEFAQNFNTAKNLFNRGRPTAALSYAQKAVQLNPRSCQAKTLLGWIYLDIGNLEEAKEQFNSASGGCPEALYGLGMVYKEQGQTQTAIMYLERFLATNPRGADAEEASRVLSTLRGE